MGIGIGIGIGWGGITSDAINTVDAFNNDLRFENRYETILSESQWCLQNSLQDLDNIGILQKASLVLTPNTYGEDGSNYSVFPVVPSSMPATFAIDLIRATTTTRENESGFIVTSSINNIINSYDTVSALWIGEGITKYDILAPDNYLGMGIIPSITEGLHGVSRQTPTNTTKGDYIFSVHVSNRHRATGGNIGYNYVRIALGYEYVDVDLEAGKILYSSNDSATISLYQQFDRSPDNSLIKWYRIAVKARLLTSDYMYVYAYKDDTFTPFEGDGIKGINLWRAQLEQSSTLSDYVGTLSLNGWPAINHKINSCPTLLVQPSKTNIMTYSEDYENAVWVKPNITVTPFYSLSPGNNVNASLIESATNTDSLQKTNTVSSAQKYIYSIYVKNASSGFITIKSTSGANVVIKRIEVTTGIVTDAGGNGIGYINAKSELLSRDWYRVSMQFTTASTTLVTNFYPGDINAVGNSSCEIWGVDLKLGPYLSAYIPTLAGAVTRNADQYTKSIPTLIGATTGAMFLDFDLEDTIVGTGNIVRGLLRLVGTSSNGIAITIDTLGKLSCIMTNTSTQMTYTSNVLNIGRYKVCVVYELNNTKVFLNGVLVLTDNACTIPAMTSINIGYTTGTNYYCGGIYDVQLYKEVLTDTECINLTKL